MMTTDTESPARSELIGSVRPQRWTARDVEASDHGGFVAIGDYLELLRWKSTHAPRLEALEGLLEAAQLEAHAGREAIATLASERAANARLTAELDEMQRQRDILQAALLEAIRVVAKVDPIGAARWMREQGLKA